MRRELRKQLEDAVAGLLYPSETDAAWEVVELTSPFPWEGRADVERMEVRQFFGELRGGPDAAGYHALYGLVAGALKDVQVVRVGEIDVTIYVTGAERELEGASAKENRVGLKTHAVET